MEDNHYYYFCLGSYLSRSDGHYIEARFLWLNLATDGAFNLFWMSIEQLIKINIITHKIESKTLQDVSVKINGHSTLLRYDPQETDIKIIHKILDKTSYKINSRHDLAQLQKILLDETGIDLSPFTKALELCKEQYERRYYKNESASFDLAVLDCLDEVYFHLRDHLGDRFPRSTIDAIAFSKKFGLGNPLPYMDYTLHENNHFRARKHPVVNMQLPDFRIIENDGVDDNVLVDPKLYEILEKSRKPTL